MNWDKVIFSLMFAFLITVDAFQSIDLFFKDKENASMKNQIDLLVQQSAVQHARYESEQKKANGALLKVNENSKLILAVDMPKNCETAVRWGIVQGGKF